MNIILYASPATRKYFAFLKRFCFCAFLVQPTSYFAMSFSNVTHDMAVGYSLRLLLVITSARPPCDVDAWQNVRRQ